MKTAKLQLGYDTVLLIPINKLQCVLDALVLCNICSKEYDGSAENLLVIKEEETRIDLGEFKPLTRQEYTLLRERQDA